MGLIPFIKGGDKNRLFLVVGTGIAGLLAYIFFAPMLVAKVSVPATPVIATPAAPAVHPALAAAPMVGGTSPMMHSAYGHSGFKLAVS